MGLGRRSGVRVKQLSGGERRRLDLALALLGRPEVLFLDERTTGLDAEGRRDTRELVRRLRHDGTAVLLTTHYLEEAELLADRLAIMHRGRIVSPGGIGMTLIIVVYSNLVSAYTARREALVLKRLRTGEVSDPEILAGIALPAVVPALTQCALMVAAGAALLHLKVHSDPNCSWRAHCWGW